MSAVQPSFVGLDMVLAYNSAGPGVTPATLVVLNARDVKRGRSKTKADVSNRGSKRKLSEPALEDDSLTFDMIMDETDAGYVAIRNAHINNTAIEFWIANGPLGTAGTVASGGTLNVVYSVVTMKVFDVEEDQPLDNGCDTTFICAPCKKTQTVAPIDNSLLA